MRRRQEPARSCVNEGCGRAVLPGEQLCETCAIERILYRRDMRSAFIGAPAEEPAVEEERSTFDRMTR